MKRYTTLFILFIFLFSTSCGTYTKSAEDYSNQSISSSSSSSEMILSCKDTDSYIGEYVKCRIPKAYCSYQSDVGGTPTFCNDAPYPSHDFTAVIWERDMSHLDGKCIIVSGNVSFYNSKPQIEVNSTSQISNCP